MKNLLTFITDVIETPIAGLHEEEKWSGQHRYVVRQTISVDENMTHKDIERLFLSNIFSRSFREINEISHLSLCALYDNKNDLEHKVMKEVFAKSKGKYRIENFSRLDRNIFGFFKGDRKTYKTFTKSVEDLGDVAKLFSLRNESLNENGTFSKPWSQCFDESRSTFKNVVA